MRYNKELDEALFKKLTGLTNSEAENISLLASRIENLYNRIRKHPLSPLKPRVDMKLMAVNTKTSGESIIKLQKKDMTHIDPGEIRNNPLYPKEGMKSTTVDTRIRGNSLNVTHMKLEEIAVKAKAEGKMLNVTHVKSDTIRLVES